MADRPPQKGETSSKGGPGTVPKRSKESNSSASQSAMPGRGGKGGGRGGAGGRGDKRQAKPTTGQPQQAGRGQGGGNRGRGRGRGAPSGDHRANQTEIASSQRGAAPSESSEKPASLFPKAPLSYIGTATLVDQLDGVYRMLKNGSVYNSCRVRWDTQSVY
eukprot:gb/GECG01009698.1/.p1 GENE.gb/GECG01009698.1/~~gb/GECG01009698.1/.p1  ORF type:complete len:161 (+),score=23.01 gb/GECG01009698.1/:1-483(+)